MDAKKYLLGAVCFVVTLAHIQAHAEARAGIVKLNADGPQYIYSPTKISAVDKIRFQFPKQEQAACCTVVDASAAKLISADPNVVDIDTGQSLYRYRLTTKGFKAAMPFVGIAVIGSNPAIHAYDDRSIKIKDGNALVTLALCTSQEGIHVVNRIDGKSPKHFYMPLGYDLENPTCDEDGLPRQDISQKR